MLGVLDEPTILIEIPCHCRMTQELDCTICSGTLVELVSITLSKGLQRRYSFRGLLAHLQAHISVHWNSFCEDRKRCNCLHVNSSVEVPDILSGKVITIGRTKHVPIKALSKKRPTELDEEIRREFKKILSHEVDESFLVEGRSNDPHGLELAN